MKKLLFATFLIALATAMFLGNSQSVKAYSNNNLIDDAVFDNAGTMSAPAIQNFLNQFPNSCLKSYVGTMPDADPYKAYFTYGGSGTAAQIIRRVADVWGINPQVILAKLEQEESLVRGNAGCPEWRYNSAMGMGCPDGGACPAPGYEGFTKQVTKGAWQLKWNKEAANGNVNWQGNGDLTYGGKMTQGNRKRCNTCPVVYYDGYYSMDGTLAHMDNGSTASLYTYTPHVPSSFPGLFETFFGVGSTSAYPQWVVFRSYDPKTKRHFYTASASEWHTTFGMGYLNEGYVFIQYPSPTNIPLYRLKKNGQPLYFYTASQAESYIAASKLDYTLEGVAFNVEPSARTGLRPVYRLLNPYTKDYLYTMSPGEKDWAERYGYYIYEGIAWYSY